MPKSSQFLLVTLFCAAMAAAQVSAPAQRTTRPAAAPAPPAALSAPAAGVAGTLSRLNQLVETTRVDLARLRIDKWKTDSNNKQMAQRNADSLQRNLTEALPGMMAAVHSNPASLAADFKLYRNLNALYDVMAAVTESAGAFGSKEEYQALAADVANLDTMRRTLADNVEQMAAAHDTELAQLQARLRQAAIAAANAPPKKIVVDEEEPAKKPAKTKKKAPPKTQPPQ